MQLQHKFELQIPAGETLDLLTRVEEITPCLPGASATKAGDNRYEVLMKIRFGPLDLAFKGVIEIVECDREAHRLVVKTKANDAKGQGSASGTTVVTMSESTGVTQVVLNTELMIGGRIAQMGRGLVSDVSNDLLARFVTNLKAKFLADSSPKGEATKSNEGSTQGITSLHEIVPIPSEASAPSISTMPRRAARPEAGLEDAYVDVGAAVRRAMWRRILNTIFFWRRHQD